MTPLISQMLSNTTAHTHADVISDKLISGETCRAQAVQLLQLPFYSHYGYTNTIDMSVVILQSLWVYKYDRHVGKHSYENILSVLF